MKRFKTEAGLAACCILFAASAGAQMNDAQSPAAQNPPQQGAPNVGTPSQTAPTQGHQTDPGAQSAERGGEQLATEDRDFIDNAAHGGHAEIEASREALESDTSAAVRDFAQKMIDDHTAVNQELAALAKEKGYTPPEEPSVVQRTEILALRAVTGGAFDSMYAARIGVAAHEDTVELFRNAASNAQDPEIRAFAEKHLPQLERHLEMARELRQTVSD